MNEEVQLDADAARDLRADRHRRLLPALTRLGFAHTRMPEALHRSLQAWYVEHADGHEPEVGVGAVVRSVAAGAASELLRIDHTSAFARSLLTGMQPLLEAWCGERLVAESIYGIRVYRRGAVLARHVDHLETHVASAVLLVADDGERPWPLVLECADGMRSEVALAPGDALLYEGARLPHRRDRPFEGHSYAAMFLHYRPVWWSYTPQRLDALDRRRPLRSIAYGRPDVVQAPVATSPGYLAFQPDYGGWNNILLQFEVMVGLAWLTGRTLVLPPPKRHYLLGDEEHDLGAFLDLDTLQRHVPVLSADAFARRIGIPGFQDYTAFSDWMASRGHAPGWNALDDVLVHPADAPVHRPELAGRIGTRRPIHLDAALAAREILWFPMTVEHRMFGVAETFFLLGDAMLHARLRRLLRDAVRYRPDLVALAERALRDPVLGAHFAALHVRRGDFQYAATQIGAERIVEHTRALFEPGTTLYVATDHADPGFFAPLRAVYHVVTFADLEVAEVTPPHAVGIVETLLCAAAPGPFAGTRLSTFSTRIATVRGHLAMTAAGRAAGLDATLHYTQPPLEADADPGRPYDAGEPARPACRDGTAEPWWVSVRHVPLWGRTYEAIWRETDDAPGEATDA